LRPGARAARLVLAAGLLAGCTNDVQLILPPGGAAGLACVDSSTGRLLAERGARPGGGFAATVVLDYLTFEGVPSCRPTQLLSWCRDRDCPVARRDCAEVSLDPPLPGSAAEIQRALLDQLRAQSPLTSDAPDGVVVVRMVMTSQPCSELAGLVNYDCDDLMGCVYSCPVQLDEVSGPVLLELDALTDTCTEGEVGICAGLGFGIAPGTELPFCAR